MNSYPGALAQIVTNLVDNSLIHGFDGINDGLIDIEVSAEGESAVMTYRDNGRGTPPEVAARIYEPFFTTRRGAGGSGLGMHIVHHLVTRQLGGTITLRSVSGQGAEFTVRLLVSAEG